MVQFRLRLVEVAQASSPARTTFIIPAARTNCSGGASGWRRADIPVRSSVSCQNRVANRRRTFVWKLLRTGMSARRANTFAAGPAGTRRRGRPRFVATYDDIGATADRRETSSSLKMEFLCWHPPARSMAIQCRPKSGLESPPAPSADPRSPAIAGLFPRSSNGPGLKKLACFPQLRQPGLQRKRVTNASLEELRKALPSCEIEITPWRRGRTDSI